MRPAEFFPAEIMKLRTIVPMLWVPDVAAAARFYCDLLGFQIAAQMETWAALEKDGAELMLSAPNEHERYSGPKFTGSLYFRVDDPDALWKEIGARANVVYPIETFDYGMREFAIRDLNGYILQFGKEVGEGE